MSGWHTVVDDGDPYIIGQDITVGPMQPVQPGLTGLVCVNCGHASLADLTHHQWCDCETCDVPGD